jgi:hypothetical protein
MSADKELPHGTGFISPRIRLLFFALSLIPASLLVIGAILTKAVDFPIALVGGFIWFLFCLVALLLLGRTVEYIRDKEWRVSPDSLSNAPRSVQIGVFAFILITSAWGFADAVGQGVPWIAALIVYAFNALVLWGLAHFFAVKVIRYLRQLIGRRPPPDGSAL